MQDDFVIQLTKKCVKKMQHEIFGKCSQFSESVMKIIEFSTAGFPVICFVEIQPYLNEDQVIQTKIEELAFNC